MRVRQSAVTVLVIACLSVPAFAVVFSPPDPLNSNTDSDSFNSDQSADIAVGANGTWTTLWRRGVPSYLCAGDIYFARSTNSGSTWRGGNPRCRH